LQQERAEASFKRKEIQAREGVAATAEYNAATQAERVKTARLRALRLAKEEQDREAAAAAKPAKPAGKAAGKKKRK
jgi:hypothetical protein